MHPQFKCGTKVGLRENKGFDSMNKTLFVFLISTSLVVQHFACAPKPTSSTSSTTSTPSNNQMVADILQLVNEHRRSKGLSALTLNNIISAEAEKHSQRMASGRTPLGHDGFDARVQSITKQIGGSISRSAENVAYGSRTAQQVVSGWLNSPGHRQNIEGQFNLTGIGVARNNKGEWYYTQLFIKK